jgi:hypothetical protein
LRQGDPGIKPDDQNPSRALLPNAAVPLVPIRRVKYVSTTVIFGLVTRWLCKISLNRRVFGISRFYAGMLRTSLFVLLKTSIV